MRFKSLVPAIALASLLASVSLPAFADDKATVEMFYNNILTASGGSDLNATAEKIIAEDWQSIGDYSGKAKNRDAFTQQIAGFQKLIPDMTWKIEQIVQSGDTYVVRGHATGTPNGPMFGVDGKGKSFSIMSIDIHEVKDGKIAKSYHVEDWAGALRQLKAE